MNPADIVGAIDPAGVIDAVARADDPTWARRIRAVSRALTSAEAALHDALDRGHTRWGHREAGRPERRTPDEMVAIVASLKERLDWLRLQAE